MAREWVKSMIIVTCGIIGILFAIMFQMMNDSGILLNAVVSTTVPLRVIQLVVILVWTIVGVWLASATQ